MQLGLERTGLVNPSGAVYSWLGNLSLRQVVSHF